ncbi:MAG TPA: hypothetical protein VJB87_01485 [Candidatus Nanoarchaeia archaeon]|nr:hypothetical protein [Candidatus Nanoarchaeia archaeon]
MIGKKTLTSLVLATGLTGCTISPLPIKMTIVGGAPNTAPATYNDNRHIVNVDAPDAKTIYVGSDISGDVSTVDPWLTPAIQPQPVQNNTRNKYQYQPFVR